MKSDRTPQKQCNQSKLPEYKIWYHMLGRCYKKTDAKYENYGGRGIKVCDAWRNDFFAFYEDMGARPRKELTLERKDVNGDYTPENCSWCTQKEQQNNRRNNFRITYKGKTKTLSEWAEIIGIDQSVLRQRLVRMKWEIEEAFTRPTKKLGPRGGVDAICELCSKSFKTSQARRRRFCSKHCSIKAMWLTRERR